MHRYPLDIRMSSFSLDSGGDANRMKDSDNLETVESYPLNQYVGVKIIRDKITSRMFYHVESQELKEPEVELLRELKEHLHRALGGGQRFDSKNDVLKFIRDQIENRFEAQKTSIDANVRGYLQYIVLRDFQGYGVIDPIMNDGNIEDISCDGVGIPIYVYHKKYQNLRSNLVFHNGRDLNNFIVLLAQKGNKQISVSDPILDASSPEGNRINATFGNEVTSNGGTFTIRLFKKTPFTPIDLVLLNTASPELMAYLWFAMEYGKNVIVLGGTGAGKTSTLNAISLFLPPDSKIVSIEDTKEINIPHKNWISAVTRVGVGEGRFVTGKSTGEIDMFDLLVSALRQRPDYMIVGEIRGKEAYNLFQAMTMGQTTLTTIHAESLEDMISRLENQPLNIPRTMLTSINIIIRQSLVRIKGVYERRITDVSEVMMLDPESNELTFNTVFRWDSSGDKTVYAGGSDFPSEKLGSIGAHGGDGEGEINRRRDVIKLLAEKGITNYLEIWNYIRKYRVDPDKTLSELEGYTGRRGGTTV